MKHVPTQHTHTQAHTLGCVHMYTHDALYQCLMCAVAIVLLRMESGRLSCRVSLGEKRQCWRQLAKKGKSNMA